MNQLLGYKNTEMTFVDCLVVRLILQEISGNSLNKSLQTFPFFDIQCLNRLNADIIFYISKYLYGYSTEPSCSLVLQLSGCFGYFARPNFFQHYK